MNFEPQCKTRADLHREMARVLDMCEAAGFDRPWEGVKCAGSVCTETGVAMQLCLSPTHYEFALAIVEGRPVFRDSEMYRADNGWRCRWDDIAKNWQDETGRWQDESRFELSWNPPRRTIEINGVKVKAPAQVRSITYHHSKGVDNRVEVDFGDSEADAEAFKAAMERKMQ